VAAQLPGVRLQFMQSSGGDHAAAFQGRDAVLSGPAAGVVGMAAPPCMPDMPGSSALTWRHFDGCIAFAGEFEPVSRPRWRGWDARADEHSYVAAGGGSILHFDGARYRVGPQFCGRQPGPAATAAVGRDRDRLQRHAGQLQPDFFSRGCSVRRAMRP